jgi:hypothetical protein
MVERLKTTHICSFCAAAAFKKRSENLQSYYSILIHTNKTDADPNSGNPRLLLFLIHPANEIHNLQVPE